jgi:hypothetical protein
MSWQDDIDKAAREWAERTYPAPAWSELTRNQAVRAFKAGASHALSRPLSEGEAIQMGTEINQAFADHRGSPTGTELARAAYSALQRMRTKG